MIVNVGNTEGGTGKTTFVVQIALERQGAGRAVLLVDADRQGSAQKVMTMLVENGHKPLACVQLAEGRLLRAQLAPLASQHDDTVIDAGGHDSEALRVAMLRADLLVVPVQPRGLDVFELATMAELIERAQDIRQDEGRPTLRVLAALSLADPGDNRAIRSRHSANYRCSPWPKPSSGAGRRSRTPRRMVSPFPSGDPWTGWLGTKYVN
jgi:chromosome partitioning protein